MEEHSALDHALEGSGIEIDGVTFRLHKGIDKDTWRVADGATRFHHREGEELTLSNVGAAMDVRFGADEDGKLTIYVADNLRPQLREIVMSLQDEERGGAVIVSIAEGKTEGTAGTFHIGGLTEVEAKAAERAIVALRNEELLATVSAEVVDSLLVEEEGEIPKLEGGGTSEWLALIEALMEARTFAASLEPYSIEHVAREISAIDQAWVRLAPPVRMGDTIIVPIKVDGAESIVSFLRERGLTVPPALGDLIIDLENLLAKSPRPLWDGNIGSCHVTTSKSLDSDVWIVDSRSRRDLDPRALGEEIIKGAKEIEVPESYSPILTALAESPVAGLTLTAEKLLDLPDAQEQPNDPVEKLLAAIRDHHASYYAGRVDPRVSDRDQLLYQRADEVRMEQRAEYPPDSSYARVGVIASADPEAVRGSDSRALEVSVKEGKHIVLHSITQQPPTLAAGYSAEEIKDLINILWKAVDEVGPRLSEHTGRSRGDGEERIPSHREDKLYVETTLGDAEDFLSPDRDMRKATLARPSGNLLHAVAEAVKAHYEGWREAAPIITRRQANEPELRDPYEGLGATDALALWRHLAARLWEVDLEHCLRYGKRGEPSYYRLCIRLRNVTAPEIGDILRFAESYGAKVGWHTRGAVEPVMELT